MGNRFLFTPNHDYFGEVTVGVKASIADGRTAEAAAYITIRPVDDAPVASDAAIHASPHDITPLEFTFSDIDGIQSPVTFSVVTQPAYGTITSAAEKFYFNPTTAGHQTQTSFTVRAFDGSLFSSRVGTISLAVGCLDADLDGFGLYCDAGEDCDDSDPSVYPGAPERADDGIAQTCGGVDLKASDSAGIFVSAAMGDNANIGSMQSPVASIAQGIALAKVAGKSVFIAGGVYGESDLSNQGVSLYGGYAEDWTRDLDANTTIIDSTTDGLLLTGGIADGLEIRSGENGVRIAGTSTLARTRIVSDGETGVFKEGTTTIARIEDTDISFSSGGLEMWPTSISINSGPLYLFRSRVEIIPHDADSSFSYGISATGQDIKVVADRNYIYGAPDFLVTAIYIRGGSAILRNNIIQPGQSAVSYTTGVHLDINNGQLLNNTIMVPQGGRGVFLSNSTYAQMANNHVQAPSGTAFDLSGLNVNGVIRNNNVLGSILLDKPFDSTKPQATTIEEMNACSEAYCLASGNISVEPRFEGETFRPETGSPLIDAGINPLLLSPYQSVPYDFAGNPRPQGAGWDIGAYEVQP